MFSKCGFFPGDFAAMFSQARVFGIVLLLHSMSIGDVAANEITNSRSSAAEIQSTISDIEKEIADFRKDLQEYAAVVTLWDQIRINMQNYVNTKDISDEACRNQMQKKYLREMSRRSLHA